MLKKIANRQYVELDNLRFLAIAMVVLHHQYATPNPFFSWISDYGGLGVDLFFTLSGFIITKVLVKEFEDRHEISLKNFWIKRFFRLWPSWILTIVLTVPFVYFLSRSNPGLREDLNLKLWHYILHFGNYSMAYWGAMHSLFGHFWSLAVEEHFYLIWPVAFLCTKKYPKSLIPVLGVLLVGPYLSRVYFTLYHPEMAYMRFMSQNRFDQIILGCVLAFRIDQIVMKSILPDVVLTLLTLGLFIFSLYYVFPHANPWLSQTFETLVGLCACGLIVLSLKGNPRGVRRVLQNRVIAKLGILSYGVYLIHVLVSYFVYGIIHQYGLTLNIYAILMINFSVPFFLAYGMYVYVDLPALSLRKYLATKGD